VLLNFTCARFGILQRVEANGKWSLFCPNEAPGLADVVGEEFKALYERYVVHYEAKVPR
jgi:hypothetical protein